MKLTTAEAIVILEKHLGVSVEIADGVEPVEPSNDWIVNTKTTFGHPTSLDKHTKVEIVYTVDGKESLAIGRAGNWNGLWRVDGGPHITKYRVLN